MSTITTRAGKGSPLTNTELDSNFTNLNDDKIESVVEDTTPQLGGDLDVNGHLVAGRNIATDGTKLDGIEAGATADQTGAEIKSLYEAESDTNAYTDAEKTKLSGIEAGADVTDTANVTAAGALMTTGGSVTGDINFGDNDKAIFGAGSDLQIYHSGTHSFITDSGTGSLFIGGDNETAITNASGTEYKVRTFSNGAVSLYYDNAAKLATTSTGIDVTGTATMDGLTVDGDAEISSANAILRLTETDTTDVNTTLRNSAGAFRVQSTNDAKTVNTQRLTVDHATGDISFYEDTGTTAKFFWDASAESLGIGTASPVGQLELERQSNANYTGTFAFEGAALQITDSSNSTTYPTASAQLQFKVGSTGIAEAYIGGYRDSANTSSLIFGTQSGATRSEKMRITSAGNVGIGTSSPDAPLHLSNTYPAIRLTDTDGASPYATIVNSSGILQLRADDNNSTANSSTQFYVDGTERMRIDSSGKVGIGTSSPSTYGGNLVVVGDVAGGESTIVIANSTTAQFARIGINNNEMQLVSDNADAIVFGRSDTSDTSGIDSEAMRIDSSGNLLVGKTGSNIATVGHQFLSDASGDYASHTSNGTRSLLLNRLASDGDIVEFRKDSAVVGSISVTGSSTAYNTSSDYRLKEDWQPVSNASDRVAQLKPVNFAWKADGNRVDGFLAHELAEVIPEAVTGEKDAMRTEEYEVSPAVLDDEGNVVTEAVMGTREVPEYQGIDQSKLVPLLTAALQEALARIEALEAKLP